MDTKLEEFRVLLASVPFLQQLGERLNVEPLEVLGLLVFALFIILVAAVALWDILRPKTTNIVLLLGLPGSGKTSLFLQLRDGSLHSGTVTSQAVNEGTFPFHSELPKNPKARPVHLVDVPGHPRLRPLMESYLPKARAVVFFVDALDFMPHIRANAEFLYEVLTHPAVRGRKVPVLIAANKMDKVTANSVDFIKKQLEKELDKLRASRHTTLGVAEGQSAVLGIKGEPFKFIHCSNVAPLVECSVVKDNVADVVSFIRLYVKP